MSAYSRMTAFFNDASELWAAMKDLPDAQYPIGDILLKPISEEESEPCDFSGALRIVQLCNTNTADFFPAIWVGEDEYEETLDQYPIYLLDLQEASEPFPPLGNFKSYMAAALEFFIRTEPEASLAEAAKAKLTALQEFSDKTTEKGDYTVSIPGEDGEQYDDQQYSDGGEDVENVDNYDEEDGDGASPPDYPAGGEAGAEGEQAAEEGEEGAEGDNSLKRKREDGDEGADE